VQNIIIDPGIGFVKTQEHNLKLLAHLDKFTKIGVPVLIGASRKSMIGKILDERPADDRLIGTVSVHYDALMKGVKILRVHDVKEASDSLRIFQAIQSQR
jgi:dihydropteroate synthase